MFIRRSSNGAGSWHGKVQLRSLGCLFLAIILHASTISAAETTDGDKAAPTPALKAEQKRPPDGGGQTVDSNASQAAASKREPSDQKPLRVAVAGSVPFVVEKADGLDGLSVEAFRAVATRAGLSHELVPTKSVTLALDRVAKGEADVAVGPISITSERAAQVDFTQPYFEAGLSILSPAQGGVMRWLKPFLTRAFATATGMLLLVLAGVGTLTWFAERRANPEQFPNSPWRGIGNGIWFALVTMTTVGYGDRAPKTVFGRIVSGVWMLIAVVALSSLTAGIASAITLAELGATQIETAGDLEDRGVAVVPGTTGAAFAEASGARVIEAKTLEDAVDKMLSGTAAAVVYDRPMLEYFTQQNPELKVHVSKRSYHQQGYGFATTKDSRIHENLNIALLRAKEHKTIDAIVTRWLGQP